MTPILDRGIASKLCNSLQATPGVTKEQAQAFRALLADLQKPGVTAGDAERQVRTWTGKAPKHAVLVVQSALLGSTYMRTVPKDSWLLAAFNVPAK